VLIFLGVTAVIAIAAFVPLFKTEKVLEADATRVARDRQRVSTLSTVEALTSVG
jgi:hypothetical protein